MYDAALFKWKVAKPDLDWFHDCWDPVKGVMMGVRRVVTHMWFEYSVCALVTINGVILLAQTLFMDGPSSSEADSIYAPWVSYFFVGRE